MLRSDHLILLAVFTVAASCTDQLATGTDSAVSVSISALKDLSEASSVRYEIQGGSLLLAFPAVTNPSSDTIRVGLSRTCGFLFKAYLSPERSGPPVWKSEDASSNIRTCPASLEFITFNPGETVELGVHKLDFIDNITQGNAPGTYYMTARIRLSKPRFTTAEFPAGQVELPGGQ